MHAGHGHTGLPMLSLLVIIVIIAVIVIVTVIVIVIVIVITIIISIMRCDYQSVSDAVIIITINIIMHNNYAKKMQYLSHSDALLAV